MNSIFKKIKNLLLTGVIVVIPGFLSVWIACRIYFGLTEWSIECFQNLEIFQEMPHAVAQSVIRFLSIVFLLILLLLIGWLAKMALGVKLLKLAQKLLMRVPIVSFIYSTCKQIGDALLSSKNGGMFHKAVLIEYPRKGCWTVGFLTNENKESYEVTEKLNEELVTVFVPTTPNPTSGFMFLVPRSECKYLDMSPADAMRLIVSCGTITKFGPPKI